MHHPAGHLTHMNRFIDALAQDCPAGCFDPWHDFCPLETGADGPAARRNRLLAHLTRPGVRLVLVGEAAGYQGCRYTGIPFTSERLLLEGRIPHLPPLTHRISTRSRPWSEPSATVVWETLHALGLAARTVLWNAVPWHPEGPRGPLANRRPTAAERRAGLPFLEWLLVRHPGARIVAVGATAARSLGELGVPYGQVRHPAFGGARRFRDGLRDLLRE